MQQDTRGAVLVIGAVMGALLVSALWHIASVGDAIIWRDRIQDAADASAFESAVWHARGMNALAAINIAMSMVLAVLVVWRIALIMVTVALLVSGVFCVLSLGATCPVTGALFELQTQMVNNDNRVATTVVRILGATRAIETAVASVTPLLAAEQANANTDAAYAVDNVRVLSASLIPAINPSGIGDLAACVATGKPKAKPEAPATPSGDASGEPPKKGALAKAGGFLSDHFGHPRIGHGVSLPVEEDSYDALCSKAGEFFLNQYAGLFERIGAPAPLVKAMDKVKGMMGEVVAKFPTAFCKPVGDGIPQELLELFSKQAKKSCDEKAENLEKEGKRGLVGSPEGLEAGYEDPEDGSIKTLDQYKKDCHSSLTKKARKEAGDKIRETAKSMTDCAKPAKVWEYAMNGNVFMRSFARVDHAAALARRDTRGISVASGAAQAAAPDLDGVLAHAEVYLDCKGDWQACKGDAMWQLRWRARLRRVQPVRNLLATAAQPALATWLNSVIKLVESPLGEIKETDEYNKAKGADKDDLYRSSAFRHAGSWLLTKPSSSPVVH